MTKSLTILIFLALSAASSSADTLDVGPGKKYAVPSAAVAAAHDGDTIRIDSAGDYFNDVAVIDRNRLTIEGVGKTRPVLKTDGRVAARKGIWVFAAGATKLTLRNLVFEGARVSDADGANGAGLRAQGTDLTVAGCRFFDNQNGILGGYGTTTITGCEFDRNGLNGLTHNVYIGDTAGTLIFKFNYSHDTVAGHLLKSRAATNVIEYNRLTDDAGTGSYELDLPNGGRADVVGNIIQQSAGSQNGAILCYGEEGVIDPKSALNVVHNTFVNDRKSGTFIDLQRAPAGFKLVEKNNIFAGPGTVTTAAPVTGGNVVTTVAKAGFVDAGKFDYRLRRDSPAVAAGVDLTGDELVPTSEYVDPLTTRDRSVSRRPDAGAHPLR